MLNIYYIIGHTLISLTSYLFSLSPFLTLSSLSVLLATVGISKANGSRKDRRISINLNNQVCDDGYILKFYLLL